ncbi:MAG: stress response protein [Gammaproteobacteria bacterium]|nr:stress response protein [Gammaproteobacteria bacterium]
MMELKTKVTLKQKGQEAYIPLKQLMVKLKWHSAVDLDLMAFYKTKDGRSGGVYSNNYAGGFLGDMNAFPFIELSGDAGVGAAGGDNEEVLRISKIDEMETIYICTLNFTDASAGRNSAFNAYDGHIEIQDDKGESIGVPLDARETGTVAVIAKIDNTGFMGAKLVNENRIIGMNEFLSMPGAEHFKLSSKVVLKSKGDSFELKQKGADGGEIVVNLNWNQKGGAKKGGLLSRLTGGSTAIDLDLGCLFELASGPKGAVQALGNSWGSYDAPPFIRHMGDDRTGAVSEGEFIRVNSARIKDIRRILFYAFIYEGISRWDQADGVVSIKQAGSPEIVIQLDEHRNDLSMCALALFESTNTGMRISKEVRFFEGHMDMDKAYRWGLRWQAGSK